VTNPRAGFAKIDLPQQISQGLLELVVAFPKAPVARVLQPMPLGKKKDDG